MINKFEFLDLVFFYRKNNLFYAIAKKNENNYCIIYRESKRFDKTKRFKVLTKRLENIKWFNKTEFLRKKDKEIRNIIKGNDKYTSLNYLSLKNGDVINLKGKNSLWFSIEKKDNYTSKIFTILGKPNLKKDLFESITKKDSRGVVNRLNEKRIYHSTDKKSFYIILNKKTPRSTNHGKKSNQIKENIPKKSIRKKKILTVENYGKEILWVGKDYRTHPWSHIPGGATIVVEFQDGHVIGYDNIKRPDKYLPLICQKDKRNIYSNWEDNTLYKFLDEYVHYVYAAKANNKNLNYIWKNGDDIKNIHKLKKYSVPSETHILTFGLIKKEFTIEQIARRRDLTKDTIIQHIGFLIEIKSKNYFNYLLPKQYTMNRVKDAFIHFNKATKLKPIYDFCNGEISYNEIKLCLLFISRS